MSSPGLQPYRPPAVSRKAACKVERKANRKTQIRLGRRRRHHRARRPRLHRKSHSRRHHRLRPTRCPERPRYRSRATSASMQTLAPTGRRPNFPDRNAGLMQTLALIGRRPNLRDRSAGLRLDLFAGLRTPGPPHPARPRRRRPKPIKAPPLTRLRPWKASGRPAIRRTGPQREATLR